MKASEGGGERVREGGACKAQGRILKQPEQRSLRLCGKNELGLYQGRNKLRSRAGKADSQVT